MSHEHATPEAQARAIHDRLAAAGEALNALMREVEAVMGRTSDEARECFAIHNQSRDWIARSAGHALKKLGAL